MTDLVHKPLTATPRGSVLNRCIRSLQAGWTRRRDMARTVRALHAMPDFALRDIGIHRSDIGGISKLTRFKDRF